MLKLTIEYDTHSLFAKQRGEKIKCQKSVCGKFTNSFSIYRRTSLAFQTVHFKLELGRYSGSFFASSLFLNNHCKKSPLLFSEQEMGVFSHYTTMHV